MRPADEKGPDDDPKARRVAAAPAVANTAEQTPDEPPAEPGNAFRARLAAKGQDPNAPPEAAPTDVIDSPSAPAHPPEEDDVEALLLGDRGWSPPPTPALKLPDLTGWVEVPSLPIEARAAWRRRLGLTHERPSDLDPGAGLLRNGAVGWVRAAAPWLVGDPAGAFLAAQARTPWGPWVAVGRAARLDAARVALVQLALLRAGLPGSAIHLAAHAARLDEFEATVRARGGRFPTVSSLTHVPGESSADLAPSAWTPTVTEWLGIRPIPAPDDLATSPEADDAVRRALAEQGLRVARELARLRARAAGIVLMAGAHGRPDAGAVARAVAAIDAQTQAILVGLGTLGRKLHQTPALSVGDARRALAALTRALTQAADVAARQLSPVADTFGSPTPPPRNSAQVDAALARTSRTVSPTWSDTPIDQAIQAVLRGDAPPAIDRAPACLAVRAIDRLAEGAPLEQVLATDGRALVQADAAGAVELILRAI